MSTIILEDKIDQLFDKKKKPICLEEIMDDLSDLEKEVVESMVNKKVENHDLIKTSDSKYISIFKSRYRKGRFFVTSKGGIVLVDRFSKNENGVEKHYESSYVIDPKYTMNAINNDEVLIEIFSKDHVRVIEILDRKVKYIVGEVYQDGTSYFLKPEDHSKDFIISLDGVEDLVVGEKLVVCLDSFSPPNFYTAKLDHRLGHKDDPGMDIILEAAKHGIDMSFSHESLEQLKSIPTKVLEKDMNNRVDLTELEIFTIDGEDTKDRDDAISLQILNNGHYLLGVHIADPAYYIPEDSPLDIDAKNKGTSVYLADTVIPMLPHQLSNGICSLNSEVLRLTQTCMMEIDQKGEIIQYDLFRSVIKSRIQMTYHHVNQILNHEQINPLYQEFISTLFKMFELSKVLYQKRILNGSINIDRDELKVKLDSKGKPISFQVLSKGPGESIVEEFMIVANETISKHLIENGLPSMNRIHERPDPEKIRQFIDLLSITGNMYPSDHIGTDCYYVQQLSQFVNSIENNGMLLLQFLKSLKRARYSSVESGHSGLAKEYYCHFTSPMRRYPDLIQNRILSDFVYQCVTDEEIIHLKNKWLRKLPELDRLSSKKERLAGYCESDVLDMKCAEYMADYIGEEYEGMIIDLDSDSMTIQLDNMIEGKVLPRNLEGRYVYYQETRSLLSLSGSEDYYLGDRLRLEICGSSKEKKVVYFKIKEKIFEGYNSKKNFNEKVKVQKKQRYFNSNKGKR